MLSFNDFVAHKGADEFILLIKDIESIDALKRKINHMIECLNKPFNINGYRLFVTSNIGICTYPENGTTRMELMRNASLALRNAIKKGKGSYHILSHMSNIQSFSNYSIGKNLKKALENNEIVLYYQPRIDTETVQITGAEAHIRWIHPKWGVISPDKFLNEAEENGLLTEMDEWLLKEVCSQIREWRENGKKTVPISIHISAAQLVKPDWPSKVAATIKHAGINGNDIEFEITESIIFNNSEMVKRTISKLKDLGIRLILSGFGKGVSSPIYLTEYPFDGIKIEKSLIRKMHQNEKILHLIKTINYMANGLQLKTIAGSVETIEQYMTLQANQYSEMQGYLFSKPVPVYKFENLMKKEILLPVGSSKSEKRNRRKDPRFSFSTPLEADIKLTSIGDRKVEVGVSKVLVENIGAGGLRFVSNLDLPIRSDVIYQFITSILEQSVEINGKIVWKKEVSEDLTEYGVQFILENNEQASLSTLLYTFVNIMKNRKDSYLPYRTADILDKIEYFSHMKRHNEQSVICSSCLLCIILILIL